MFAGHCQWLNPSPVMVGFKLFKDNSLEFTPKTRENVDIGPRNTYDSCMGSPMIRAEMTSRLPSGYKGSRGEILIEVKCGAALTARDLADRLGLSLNAVRHHLKELEAAGLISHRREQRGVGAPVFVYVLTPAAESLFPQQYEDLVTRALQHVADREGRQAVVALMEDRYRALAVRIREEVEANDPTERVAVVARMLAEEGYMAEWEEENGGLVLREHNCAIRAVAERFPEICDAEARFLRDVLGTGVERRLHILEGCRACEYNIETERI